MTDKAVIAGSLVNAVNIASHKSVRLHIDVPAELGQRIVEAFGWPTQAAPVAVAVARIVEGAKLPKPSTEPLKAVERPRKTWAELTPAQQAGIRCGEEEFVRYLTSKFPNGMRELLTAEGFVRHYCGVDSRSLIHKGTEAEQRWNVLESAYQAHLAQRQYAEVIR
jgi:hypothetical protein